MCWWHLQHTQDNHRCNAWCVGAMLSVLVVPAAHLLGSLAKRHITSFALVTLLLMGTLGRGMQLPECLTVQETVM